MLGRFGTLTTKRSPRAPKNKTGTEWIKIWVPIGIETCHGRQFGDAKEVKRNLWMADAGINIQKPPVSQFEVWCSLFALPQLEWFSIFLPPFVLEVDQFLGTLPSFISGQYVLCYPQYCRIVQWNNLEIFRKTDFYCHQTALLFGLLKI